MRPSDEEILKAIAAHFSVSTAVAKAWIDDMMCGEDLEEKREKHDL